jgi:hypothetical protein
MSPIGLIRSKFMFKAQGRDGWLLMVSSLLTLNVTLEL